MGKAPIGSLWAPPNGSGMMWSITPNFTSSGAVIFNASVAYTNGCCSYEASCANSCLLATAVCKKLEQGAAAQTLDLCTALELWESTQALYPTHSLCLLGLRLDAKIAASTSCRRCVVAAGITGRPPQLAKVSRHHSFKQYWSACIATAKGYSDSFCLGDSTTHSQKS